MLRPTGQEARVGRVGEALRVLLFGAEPGSRWRWLELTAGIVAPPAAIWLVSLRYGPDVLGTGMPAVGLLVAINAGRWIRDERRHRTDGEVTA